MRRLRARCEIQPAGASGPRSPAAETTAAQRAPAVNRPPTPKGEAIPPAADVMAIQIDLAWTGDYNGCRQRRAQREDHRRRQSVPAQPQIQRNRRAQSARARPARSDRKGETGASRLADDRRPRHRCAARTSDQASLDQGGGEDRHPLVVGARTGAGRDLPDPRARHHAGAGLRAADARSRPPARLEVNLLQSDFFILSGMQGLKRFYVRGEIRGRRGARPDRSVRPGDRAGDGAGCRGNVERLRGDFRASRAWRRSARNPGARSSTRPASSSAMPVTFSPIAPLTDGCNVIVVSGYGDATGTPKAMGSHCCASTAPPT